MSFANSLRRISSEFNAGLRIFKCNVGLNTCPGAIVGALKSKDDLFLKHQLSLSRVNNTTEKFCLSFPQADLTLKKNIIEPIKTIKISFELPIRSSTDTVLDLPCHIKTEIKEPPSEKVINKRAAHIVVIRKKKMKKHKHKKYLRKNKIKIAKKRLEADMKKESEFQLSLKNLFKEVESYCPQKYVNETLQKVHWQKPITRVRGYLAPKWVVKQYLEEEEEKKIIRERIEECLKKEIIFSSGN